MREGRMMRRSPCPSLLCCSFFVVWWLVRSDRVWCESDQTYCLFTCGNLTNLTYPFGTAGVACAEKGFSLDDCGADDGSGHGPTWTLGRTDYPVQNVVYTHRVTNGASPGGTWQGYLDLRQPDGGPDPGDWACASPLPPSRAPFYAPLDAARSFPSAALLPSDRMRYLMLNCTNTTSSSLVDFRSEACHNFNRSRAHCSSPPLTSCAQFSPNSSINDTLESLLSETGYNCSSFLSFFVVNNSYWSSTTLRMEWTNLTTEPSCKSTNCNHTQASTRSTASSRSSSRRKTLEVVLPVVGASIAVVLVGCGLLAVQRRKYAKHSAAATSGHFGGGGRGGASNRFWTERAKSLSLKCGPASGAEEFLYADLVLATDDFSDRRLVGDGGFGAVYSATLKDGRRAAVKRLYHDNFRRMEHFWNEIRILSSLKHPHLVRLYGFCCQDERDLLLVFEFASRGTVADHLHDPAPAKAQQGLPWKVRLNIAVETAEALAYLHTSGIFHRDVKTANILLDEDFHAKLADFGLSRLVPPLASHVSTSPQGTPGYLDPDYHQCYQLTDKSDVYSFGVVLVELVSAKLAVDLSRNRGEINLSSLALAKITSGAWRELVDPRLAVHLDADVERMVKGVVEAAFSCLQTEKDDRPTMSSVLDTLSRIRDFGYPPDHGSPNVDAHHASDETSLIKAAQTPSPLPPSPVSALSWWPSFTSTATNDSSDSLPAYHSPKKENSHPCTYTPHSVPFSIVFLNAT